MGICGETLSEHGTSVPIGSTVISGLKSRAPTTTNINLSTSVLKLWDTCEIRDKIQLLLSVDAE